MPDAPFETDIAELIWDDRYRYRVDGVVRDRELQDTWRRVAHALAGQERQERQEWERRFFSLLQDFRFLPGGRILAGAGTEFDVTLFNCFVMGTIEDSMAGIFEALKEGALTMQLGGGVGYDFSTLRPAGTPAWRVGGVASGPVSFMRIWDSMCETLLSTAARRGAMMATLRSPRYRGLHRGQAVRGSTAQLQSLGAGQRCLHAGGRGRCRVAAGFSCRRPRWRRAPFRTP